MAAPQSAARVALIVGAGPGLGLALARAFAADGYDIALASRTSAPTISAALAPQLPAGRRCGAYACDATREADVASLFATIAADSGGAFPEVVIYNASGPLVRKPVSHTSAAEFEAAWRGSSLGAFLVARAAAAPMAARGRGVLIFTGATASVRGGAGFAAFAAAKAGERVLAQSLAREMGPRGVHVAHVVVDGIIGSGKDEEAEGRLSAAALAETYVALARQRRGAWTHELDVRPYDEAW
jgi:NAD(P)-dependent dehydrogenase (short-subunit alcohol dehydrogenase family)